MLCRRTGWVFQTYDSGPTTKQSWTYPTALAYGAWHRFAVTWDGAQATVHNPDGTTYVMPADGDITAWWQNFATIETVGGSDKNTASIRSFAVSTDIEDVPRPTIYGRNAAAVAAVPGSNASVTIGATYSVVASTSIVVPPSKKVAVIATLPVSRDNAVGRVQLRAEVGNNLQSYSATDTTLEDPVAFNGTITFIGVLDLGGFTAGTTQTLNIRAAYGNGTPVVTFRETSAAPVRRNAIVVTETSDEQVRAKVAC